MVLFSGRLCVSLKKQETCAVSKIYIGIPFGIQHLKLALLALAPVGKTIVTIETAEATRLYAAQSAVARQRS